MKEANEKQMLFFTGKPIKEKCFIYLSVSFLQAPSSTVIDIVISHFSYPADEFDLGVTITREGTVQLRLTDPSLGSIPLPVRLKIRFIDTIDGSVEERFNDGAIADSANIFYEDTSAPYQRFRVQVALVVGNVTGPPVPTSLEDATVHGKSRSCW